MFPELVLLPGEAGWLHPVLCILCCTSRRWQVQPGCTGGIGILHQINFRSIDLGRTQGSSNHNMSFTALHEFFGRSVKDEQVLLTFVLKMEVRLCQDFTQQESLCATEKESNSSPKL